MNSLQLFASQHQDFFIIFVWPTLTALLSFLLKSISSHPKTIAIANILSALGFDSQKLVQSAQEFIQPKKDPSQEKTP